VRVTLCFQALLLGLQSVKRILPASTVTVTVQQRVGSLWKSHVFPCLRSLVHQYILQEHISLASNMDRDDVAVVVADVILVYSNITGLDKQMARRPFIHTLLQFLHKHMHLYPTLRSQFDSLMLLLLSLPRLMSGKSNPMDLENEFDIIPLTVLYMEKQTERKPLSTLQMSSLGTILSDFGILIPLLFHVLEKLIWNYQQLLTILLKLWRNVIKSKPNASQLDAAVLCVSGCVSVIRMMLDNGGCVLRRRAVKSHLLQNILETFNMIPDRVRIAGFFQPLSELVLAYPSYLMHYSVLAPSLKAVFGDIRAKSLDRPLTSRGSTVASGDARVLARAWSELLRCLYDRTKVFEEYKKHCLSPRHSWCSYSKASLHHTILPLSLMNDVGY